ncbi:MAG: FAD-dependent oxidoreductase [Dehalococcoidia bacterium]|nr:FAD-dependent oxidoreductase [Dehalococcoidia bacterium]
MATELISLTIDKVKVEVPEGTSILEAARQANLYIPTLCSRPDLPPYLRTEGVERVYTGKDLHYDGAAAPPKRVGCSLCMIDVEGVPRKACSTAATPGMNIMTLTTLIDQIRKDNLSKILARHPHVCLMCAQREGCSRTDCSMNVPVLERCCEKFGNCEIRKVSDYIGIKPDTPRYVPRDLPAVRDEPLFVRDYNLCVHCGRCVRACFDLRGIGALGITYQNDAAVVGHLGPTLAESGCKFCGACVEVCPTGTLMDKAKGATRESLVPCQTACPVGMHVPDYVRFIGQGRYVEAATVIRGAAPLSSILGKVCFHPCETACRRGEVNEPISICRLKGFAVDEEPQPPIAVASETGKKVAVIGSGPAGLASAHYLRRLGHAVTIFEALPEAGGMLRVGIPAYRLPREQLQEEIDSLKALGVEIRTGTRVESVDALMSDGCHAVFVAVGAHRGRRLGVEGEEHGRTMDCVDFLRETSLGHKVEVGKRVVVVGGGNAAIDASRTALRLGASDVTVVYRRSYEEMPALESEVREAEAEGVKFRFQAAPVCFISGGQVQCVEMDLGELDASGRPKPMPREGSEFLVDADLVISAIGQAPEVSESFGVSFRNGLIEADAATLATSKAGVFAGGDAVTGPASVVEAIAAGKKAAASIHRYLGGQGFLDDMPEVGQPNPSLGREEGFASIARVPVRSLPAVERAKSFSDVDLGYDEALAVAEARRCLQCDLRFCISPPVFPPEKWLELTGANVAGIPEVEGVFQLLTEEKAILQISGVMNVRKGLEEQLGHAKARYFLWEENPMYTKRESELIQEYLQEHGRLPEGNDALDDLF